MLIKGEEGARGTESSETERQGKEEEEVEVKKAEENSKWVILRTKIQLF